MDGGGVFLDSADLLERPEFMLMMIAALCDKCGGFAKISRKDAENANTICAAYFDGELCVFSGAFSQEPEDT